MTFLRSVLPYVLKANQLVTDDRAFLISALERTKRGGQLGRLDRQQVQDLADRYRLDQTVEFEPEANLIGVFERLLGRVDVIPPSLALAQAAVETGWGSSRFLREGNALFGQLVFSAQKGMSPTSRPEGANYSVARFDRLGEAVAAYMHNLNTFWAYSDFRSIRTRLRKGGRALDSLELAGGLLLYAETRERYIRDIQSIIRVNRLARLDTTRLDDVDPERLDRLLSADGQFSEKGRVTPPEPDV